MLAAAEVDLTSTHRSGEGGADPPGHHTGRRRREVTGWRTACWIAAGTTRVLNAGLQVASRARVRALGKYKRLSPPAEQIGLADYASAWA